MSRKVALALALACASAAPGCMGNRWERIRWERIRGAGAMRVRLDYTRAVDDAVAPGQTLVAGPELRGMLGRRLGVALGLGFEFGADLDGGFAHDEHLQLGLGVRFGRTGFALLTGGIGGSGVAGSVPSALEFPAELLVEVDLGGYLRATMWARPSWVLDDARDSGAEHAPFADELSAGAGLRLGSRVQYWDGDAGSGYLIGAQLRERGDERYLGLVLAFSMGGGTLLR